MERLLAGLSMAFGALATLLAAIGLLQDEQTVSLCQSAAAFAEEPGGFADLFRVRCTLF